jgi:aminoglycoside phosphotransferase (APT) family kinase protein
MCSAKGAFSVTHLDPEIDRIAGTLLAYLRGQLGDARIEYDLPLTRLLGGFETTIYQFKLRGAPGEMNRSLVLRLYPERCCPDRALWESRVQNALASEGYPVAQVYFVCTDPSVLNGAFFVMDFLPGELLTTTPSGRMLKVLGHAHATLHKGDPAALIASLVERGIDAGRLRLVDRVSLGQTEFPWAREGISWLVEHRPSEPEHMAVCHGDFHPLNLLVQDGKVTGILDWAELSIADPAWDVANTFLRILMPYKYLVSGLLGPGFASVDWNRCAQMYLDAYRAHHRAGTANLEYYVARQSLTSLVDGVRGHAVWRHPPIAEDLIALFDEVTGIRIAIPDQTTRGQDTQEVER